jgi:hypothetical protein
VFQRILKVSVGRVVVNFEEVSYYVMNSTGLHAHLWFSQRGEDRKRAAGII